MSAPSDLELMMYFDEELEEPRRTDVAAWLATDEAGAAKLYGLGQVSSFLLESSAAKPTARAAEVVDAVMAAIASGDESQSEARSLRPPIGHGVTNGVTKKSTSSSVTDAVVRPIGTAKRAEAATAEVAANDNNGRLIFGIAAIAAVAAAAMFFWGRTNAPTTADNAPPPINSVATAGVSKTPSVLEPVGALPSATAEAEQESSGAEVAAVDFGSRSGSIYYVSGASQGATTAVVWLTDE